MAESAFRSSIQMSKTMAGFEARQNPAEPSVQGPSMSTLVYRKYDIFQASPKSLKRAPQGVND